MRMNENAQAHYLRRTVRHLAATFLFSLVGAKALQTHTFASSHFEKWTNPKLCTNKRVVSNHMQVAERQGTSYDGRTVDAPVDDQPRYIIRRGLPEEIDELSQLVARCFREELVQGDFKAQNSTSFPNALAVVQEKVENFATRWTIYAGMVQRLVLSSYNCGLGESKSNLGPRDMDVVDAHVACRQPLFVAEVVESCRSESQDDGYQGKLVGVVELAYGNCPLPLYLDSSVPRRETPFVCNLVVLPSHRGFGIGKALLERVEEAAMKGEGLSLQSRISRRATSEIWLETAFDNTPALRMYQASGYVCEGIDPEMRQQRFCYMRKRLSEESPSHDKDILCILRDENEQNRDEPVWRVTYTIDEYDRCIVKKRFLEKEWGNVSPVVAILGTLAMDVAFWLPHSQ